MGLIPVMLSVMWESLTTDLFLYTSMELTSFSCAAGGIPGGVSVHTGGHLAAGLGNQLPVALGDCGVHDRRLCHHRAFSGGRKCLALARNIKQAALVRHCLQKIVQETQYKESLVLGFKFRGVLGQYSVLLDVDSSIVFAVTHRAGNTYIVTDRGGAARSASRSWGTTRGLTQRPRCSTSCRQSRSPATTPCTCSCMTC